MKDGKIYRIGTDVPGELERAIGQAKVSTENGPIAIGDSIALSSVAGVGMKASGSGERVGIALEAYSGTGIGTIDIFANLGQNVDLNQFALASSTNASTTVISDELTVALASIQSLQSQTSNLSALLTGFSSSTSNFAISLASSTSFIQTIADAVVSLLNSSNQVINSAGKWTVGEITALNGTFQKVIAGRVETQTAAISNGLEMTDQATGSVYCVVIKNGDWDKTLGPCGVATTSTTTVTSIPAVNPVTNNTTSSPAPVQNTVPPIVVTSTSTATSTTTIIPVTSSAVSASVGTTSPTVTVNPQTTSTSTTSSAPVVTPTPSPDTTTPVAPAPATTPTPVPAQAPVVTSTLTTAPAPTVAPAPDPTTSTSVTPPPTSP